jgi:hypothetical protein
LKCSFVKHSHNPLGVKQDSSQTSSDHSKAGGL